MVNVGLVTSPARVLTVALALGWAVDLLFNDKALGISFLLFVLLLLIALFALSGLESVAPVRRNLWLLAPLLFFSAMVFVRANVFVTILNVTAGIVLLGILAYFYSAGRVERLGVFGYLIVLVLSMFNSLSRPGPMVRANVNVEAVRRQSSARLLPLLRGLLIALPILLVFTCLLASADMVFADLLGDAFQMVFLFNPYDMLRRTAIVLVSAWLVAGGLAYALSRRAEPEDGQEPAEGYAQPGDEDAHVDALLGEHVGFHLLPVEHALPGRCQKHYHEGNHQSTQRLEYLRLALGLAPGDML